jgi:hypothetical protein
VFATGLFDSVERNITSEGYIVSFTAQYSFGVSRHEFELESFASVLLEEFPRRIQEPLAFTALVMTLNRLQSGIGPSIDSLFELGLAESDDLIDAATKVIPQAIMRDVGAQSSQ